MQTKPLRLAGGWGLIIGSVLLFAYAVLFPVLLPLDRAASEYASVVASPGWQPLCIAAFTGVLCTMIGFAAVYGRIAQKTGALGIIGFLVVEFAHLLQAAKVTWEYCIYPFLAKHAAALLNDGILKTDPTVLKFQTLAMLSIFIGIVTFCIAVIRSKAFPCAAGYLVLAGAFVYGIGPLISLSVAIAGIALYSIGSLWLGLHLLRTNESP